MMDSDTNSNDSCWVTTFVFIWGFVLGAGAAILIAPEPGTALRERLARGAKTAQEEFSEVAGETKEAFRSLSQDTQRTVKHAASRLNTALESTKQALSTEPPNPGQSDI
ncbi:MAG: YtxH domain-containing protein [Nitrospirota bacterium]|nr:YtxH domain-containing protein [Nitrospirota bacterium]